MQDTDPSPVPGADTRGVPGSSSRPHPTTGIPLPAHGFETLDALSSGELADTPAVEVITQAATILISASAENLGLATDDEPRLDLDDARRLITALAGLLAASQDDLGAHAAPLRDGLRTLQAAFREASSFPDEPGHGPGEALLS